MSTEEIKACIRRCSSEIEQYNRDFLNHSMREDDVFVCVQLYAYRDRLLADLAEAERGA